MKTITGIFAIMLGVLTSDGCAQALPTNADLKAAYCIGVSNAAQGTLRAAKDYSDQLPVEVGAKSKAFIAEREESRRRLKLYLLPRLSGLDPTGIIIAAKTGENDFAKGVVGIENCMASCKPSNESGCEHACMDAASTITTRIRSCNDISWLPY